MIPSRETGLYMSNTLSDFSNELAGVVERVAPSVVTVHGNARSRMSPAGVVWRKGFIATTDSGLRRDEDIHVTLPDGARVPAVLKGRDASTDLAVLACDTGSAAPAAFHRTPPRPGELVLT